VRRVACVRACARAISCAFPLTPIIFHVNVMRGGTSGVRASCVRLRYLCACAVRCACCMHDRSYHGIRSGRRSILVRASCVCVGKVRARLYRQDRHVHDVRLRACGDRPGVRACVACVRAMRACARAGSHAVKHVHMIRSGRGVPACVRACLRARA
jgi:hypothetical protein